MAFLGGANALDGWVLAISILTFLVATVAAAAAVIGLREPKLEVTGVRLRSHIAIEFVGELLTEQENYPSPPPDNVLLVSLVNRGKAIASKISGTLIIVGSDLTAMNYPGYTRAYIRTPLTGFVGEQIVEIPASDEHRALPASTNHELIFKIPVMMPGSRGRREDLERLYDKEVRIAYQFFPERGTPIEGEWIVEMMRSSERTRRPIPANSGPVPERERVGGFPTPLPRVPLWKKILTSLKIR